jgi:hypothetical protein
MGPNDEEEEEEEVTAKNHPPPSLHTETTFNYLLPTPCCKTVKLGLVAAV